MDQILESLTPEKKESYPLSPLEKSQIQEREALIRIVDKIHEIEKDFNNGITQLKEKYKEALLANADKERRLRSIEHLRDTTNIPLLAKEVDEDHKFIETVKNTWKSYVFLASIIGVSVGFILGSLANLKKLFP